MGTSWRINTREQDRTEITATSSQIVGATVINAPKGPKEFTFFNKGETKKVLDTFGYPSKEYPSIQDALDVVKTSSMWIASPYKDGTYGGVFVTSKGTVPFTRGVKTKDIKDLSKVDSITDLGKGNGVLTSFKGKVVGDNRINSSTLVLRVGETSSNLTIGRMGALTDSSKLLAEGSKIDVESGEVNLVFTLAPTSKKSITIEYQINVDDTKFILFDQNMQKDDLQVKVIKSENVDNAFDVTVYRYSPLSNDYEELAESPYTIGLKSTSKDNEGSNIFIENVFSKSNQLMFTPLVIDDSDPSTFIDDTIPVSLGGGSRGTPAEVSDFSALYEELQDSTTYDIRFAFDPMGYPEVVTVFRDLRNNYQKYCRFEYCTPNVKAHEIIAEPSTYGVISDNRGLYCYCLTWGIHRDAYQGNDFLCSNMGLIASKLVGVLEVGGGVPAWIDENGVGGILGGSITKLMQRASEPELEKLNKLCFNPIVMDVKYGAMIEGWKTRQVKETVYSYIGQSSLTDTILELIVKNVLPPRIGKLIDDTTYSAVRSECNTILRTYSQWLEDYYVLCDDTNNTDETKNAQRLQVAVGIIHKGYASQIDFNFSTFKNGINIEEEIKNI